MALNLKDIDVAEGQTKRMNCPSCSGTNTFTISKQMGVVVYNCYKLGCTARGMSTVGMSAMEIKAALDRMKDTVEITTEKDTPTMELPVTLGYDLSAQAVVKFISKWDIAGVPLMYDLMQHRVVFPIMSGKGRLIDANGRTLRGDVPKWYRYTGNANYYDYGKGSVAVVLEDCISAAVVGKHIPGAVGVAILGTSINMKHIDYLKKFDKVVVALDPDAWYKTLQYVQMLKSHSINATAMKVRDDLKYMVIEDIEELKRIVKH